jgi:hypothetical protein
MPSGERRLRVNALERSEITIGTVGQVHPQHGAWHKLAAIAEIDPVVRVNIMQVSADNWLSHPRNHGRTK